MIVHLIFNNHCNYMSINHALQVVTIIGGYGLSKKDKILLQIKNNMKLDIPMQLKKDMNQLELLDVIRKYISIQATRSKAY